MALQQNQINVLTAASPECIESEFSKIQKNWASSRWVQKDNTYLTDTIEKLKSPPLNIPHLRQYIAASTIHHCIDGWGYLGRSLNALLSGDNSVACHLAYYAELRAAISILASQGIGVFSNKHYIVDANGICTLFPNGVGTHLFTWIALEHWASTNKADYLISKVMRPAGVPLREWLNIFSASPGTNQLLATKWLEQWGIDLQKYSDDRNSRNSYSYRPTRINTNHLLNSKQSVEASNILWSAFEPRGEDRFSILDFQCLKASLEVIFKETQGISHKRASVKYSNKIEAMINQLPQLSSKAYWLDRITNNTGSGNTLFEFSKKDSSIGSDSHPIEMASRAAFLLRLATGASRNLFNKVSADSSEIEFWWKPFGLNHGLWVDGNEPQDFSDLWIDIQEALDDIETWLSTNSAPLDQMQKFTQIPRQLISLCSCERIPLWGVGL